MSQIDYSQKWEKKNKKTKPNQKIFTKPIKNNYKKDCENIKEIFLKMKKKKKIIQAIEIKISDEVSERKKEYVRNYYYKSKNLLNHLINCVEELENVSLINEFEFLKE